MPRNPATLTAPSSNSPEALLQDLPWDSWPLLALLEPQVLQLGNEEIEI